MLTDQELTQIASLIKDQGRAKAKAAPDPAQDVSRAWETVKGWARSGSLLLVGVLAIVAIKWYVTDPELRTAIYKLATPLLAATVGYWLHRIIVKIRPHEIPDLALRIEANRVRALYIVGAMLAYALT